MRMISRRTGAPDLFLTPPVLGGLAHLEKEAEFCLRSHEVIFGPTLTSSPNELPTGASQGVD